MSSLDGLNPAQRHAAETLQGPVLIVAGAGAGKTKTITSRIGHLIETGVAPGHILAITFTNKAAREMRDRVAIECGTHSHEVPFIGTFHALGTYILRNSGQPLGISRYFSIIDKDDALALVKAAERDVGIDEKRFAPRKILRAISRSKGDGRDLAEYEADYGGEYFGAAVVRVWRRYRELLTDRQGLDFDDLLLRTVELLEQEPSIRQTYQDRWRYLHVDEYQDTNKIQYRLTQLLTGPERNLCVVGDIDQSIYSWRGADYTNILEFENDYPEAVTIVLEENYRSTKTILDAANAVIKKNKNRKEKNLYTRNHTGEKIKLFSGYDEADEATFIAEVAGQLLAQGVPGEDIAVLYRANFQSRALEEAFLRSGVPYCVLGTQFFERKEVRDVLAYLKAALNPADLESWKRAAAEPPRGIGKATVAKVAAGSTDTLSPALRRSVGEFNDVLENIRTAAMTEKPSVTLKRTLAVSGIEAALRRGTEDDQERLENVRELVTLASRFDSYPPEEGIAMFLAESALASDQDKLDQAPKGARLLTVHAAKGLEFRHVFITGLEQDLFPHHGYDPDGLRDGEEERRLFYVALTRAREQLYLTYAQSRTIFGTRRATLPSEFIFDINEELFDGSDGENQPITTSYITIDG